MKEAVDFCFKDRQRKYMTITKYGETWVNNTNKYNISFDKKTLKLAINYLLDQYFFDVGSLTFQTIGNPMESEPAPFLAKLFLFPYESK